MQTQAWYFFISGKEQFVENDPVKTVGYFHGETIQVPSPLAYDLSIGQSANVLGDTSANKRIEVDLSNQKVYAFEGDRRVYEFIVSTGKWGRTPTGSFTIHSKVGAQAMKGGNRALGTYYYLPNVQNVQFFGNDQIPWWKGYSFHSTYWHSNFGHPMSHGCINMKPEDSAVLYQWTQPDLRGKRSITASGDNPGTTVTIYGTTPPS